MTLSAQGTPSAWMEARERLEAQEGALVIQRQPSREGGELLLVRRAGDGVVVALWRERGGVYVCLRSIPMSDEARVS